MRIVFMGTPDFAVPSLDILVNNGYQIVLVVTQPDKPKGRGHQLASSPIKDYAISHGLAIAQPEKIGEEQSVELLKSLQPDLFVTCAFGQFLPQRVLDIPRMGTVNVHGSLLPKYRGAAPIQWAIINGDKVTGITTMLTVLKMDAGDILLKSEIELDDEITAGQLYDRMSLLGAETLLKTICGLEAGTITPVPQPECDVCTAQKITRETGKINWEQSAVQIHNLVRGTNPWPGAYSWFKDERMRVWKTRVIDDSKVTQVLPGTILEVNREGFVVQTGKGILGILEVQCDNAKRLTVNQYVCGHIVRVGDRFGTE